MSALDHLGLALALATLAGLNVYLTAFLAGHHHHFTAYFGFEFTRHTFTNHNAAQITGFEPDTFL